MLSADLATTVEGHAVHDRAAPAAPTSARSRPWRGNEDGEWRLYGDKWFCSHADADVALMLARPEGAPAGTRGPGAVRAAAPAEATGGATPTASSG